MAINSSSAASVTVRGNRSVSTSVLANNCSADINGDDVEITLDRENHTGVLTYEWKTYMELFKDFGTF